MKTLKGKPNPGSNDAQRLGCNCPRSDNAFGAGLPYPGGPRFVVRDGCPLHWPKENDAAKND